MFYIGLDLGQKRDYSAVAIVHRTDYGLAWMSAEFFCMKVRHLERIPLGTPYTTVADRMRGILQHPELHGHSRLVVDATGLGAPVLDMLRKARLNCPVSGVTITSGDHAHARGEDWHVPKKDLLSNLQLLIEEQRLKVTRHLAAAQTLVDELINMRLWERQSIGAQGPDAHDDLAMALALACWRARRKENGFGHNRLPGI
jgi:hypothetical protein